MLKSDKMVHGFRPLRTINLQVSRILSLRHYKAPNLACLTRVSPVRPCK